MKDKENIQKPFIKSLIKELKKQVKRETSDYNKKILNEIIVGLEYKLRLLNAESKISYSELKQLSKLFKENNLNVNFRGINLKNLDGVYISADDAIKKLVEYLK